MIERSQSMSKVACPVCRQHELDEDFYEICPTCGWGGDSYQRTHPNSKAFNTITLTEAKSRYEKYGTIEKHKIIQMGGTV